MLLAGLIVAVSLLVAGWRSGFGSGARLVDQAAVSSDMLPLESIPRRPSFPAPSQTSADAAMVAVLRDEAFEVAEAALTKLEGVPDALCMLASVHHRYASEETAVQLWQRSLELDPQCADALHALGLQANAAGDFATAERHFRAALAIKPATSDVALPLTVALVGQGKYREVVDLLEPLSRAPSPAVEVWWRLGQAYHQLGDCENACRCHQEALALNPDSSDAHYGAALALDESGASEEARQHFDQFRTLRDEEERAARVAQQALTDEIRVRTTLVNTCLAAGRVYLRHGLTKEARQLWRRAADLDPQNLASRELLCEWFVRQDRLTDAIPWRQSLCKLDSENPRQWLELGMLYGKTRQPDEAAAAFRQAIGLAPNDALAYSALAEIEMLPGRDLPEAVRLAERAVALDPSARNHYVLATARFVAGDKQRARVALEEAIRQRPDEREYREAYARLANDAK
jgi:tetratricopeptide (TPR) repeat protein